MLSVENYDGEIGNPPIQGFGDTTQVLRCGRIDLNAPPGGGTNDDLIHINIGGMEQTAPLGAGQDRDGTGGTGSA